MTHTLIVNARVITPEQVWPDHCLDVQDGQITAIFPNDRLPALPPETEIIDAGGAYAAPGLMDLHIHGFAGFGPEQGTAEALLHMSEALAGAGVTAFCPTLYCGQPQDMLRILRQTVPALGREKGARILGYHLEGPFISPHKPGVMKPQDIAPVSLPVLQQLYDAAEGHLAAMTVAPELPGLEPVISFCRQHHILLQAGHTNATYEQFLRGAAAGITHTTHLFNAMSPFTHRAPGAAGAVLMHPDISAEIIADGVHVHPDVVGFLRRIKPLENIVLVTDALLPTGQTQGPFLANGEEVAFDGVWRRKTDGVIAGSGLTLLQGIKNLVDFGYTLPEAVRCASTNPARLLGLSNQGTLAPGMQAHITLFDAQFRPLRTLLA